MRNDPVLSERYKKDAADEQFLEHFNDLLEGPAKDDYASLEETLPTVQVVGVPRSGTTLLTQLLSFHLNVGSINNLIAAFWKAPVYGIRLHKKLSPQRATSSFKSDFGRTIGLQEPHEFGYFWHHHFGHPDMSEPSLEASEAIDWEFLKKTLINMCAAYGSPIVFKAMVGSWHIQRMQRLLPKTCFVRIRRDRVDNALSLIDYREKVLGSKEIWGSLRPNEYEWLKDEPYWVQAAGQVLFLENKMSAQLETIGKASYLEVQYNDLCAHPQDVLKETAALVNRNGGNVSLVGKCPDYFPRDHDRFQNHPDRENLVDAFSRLAMR